GKHTELLLKRLAQDLPVVVLGDKRGMVLAYSNGTWFQLKSHKPASPDAPHVFSFLHGEPYLRKTFKGTTAELRQVILDGLSGKKKLPAPDEKELPGFGPEVQAPRPPEVPAKKSALPPARGGLVAVIPTLGLGGPLAILALLFPSVFGGALLFLRRWIMLLTVVSVNSTLYCLYAWSPRWLQGSSLARPLHLWYTLTLITLAGTFWAWRRHLRSLSAEAAPAPRRSEQIILWVLSVAGIVGMVVALWGEPEAV